MVKKRRRRQNPAHCPCGQGERYRVCCGRFHSDEAVPKTPAELMRSRYAAYAKGKVEYIVDTTDPMGEAWQEPVPQWRDDIRKFGEGTEFLGVDVLDEQIDADTGMVRFRARLRADGRDASFVERSEFVRREGRWLYTAGEVEASS